MLTMSGFEGYMTVDEANDIAGGRLLMNPDTYYQAVISDVPLQDDIATKIDFLVRAGRINIQDMLAPLFVIDAYPNQNHLDAAVNASRSAVSPINLAADSGLSTLRHGVILPGPNGDQWVRPGSTRREIPFVRIMGALASLNEIPEGVEPLRLELVRPEAQ